VETSTRLANLKGFIYHGVVAPIRNPYLPREYRETYRRGTPLGRTVESLLDPYLKKRDRNAFKKALRSTDVFIVGHPKSGNTWLAYMLAILFCSDRQHEVTMANVGRYVPCIHGRDADITKYGNLSNPRLFRNEYPVHPLLYPKTVYLLRDPRAVLVSYYHMYGVVRPNDPMSLDSFVDEYLAKGFLSNFEPLERWDRQVLAWHRRAQEGDRVLLVKYEDMVEDRKGVLEKVARFINVSPSVTRLAEAVERGAFAAMQKDEEAHGAESYLKIKDKRENFVRRGKTDGWKDEMNPVLATRVEREFGPMMKAAGYL
jgi:hypothetical protein